MNVEEALFILDTALHPKVLNNVQELVFRQAWEGQTYQEIAKSSGYNANYIKDVGYQLWKLISKAFEEEVTKSNFRSVLRRRYFAFQHAGFSDSAKEESPSVDPKDSVSEVSGSVAQRKEIARPKQIGESQQTPVNTKLQLQVKTPRWGGGEIGRCKECTQEQSGCTLSPSSHPPIPPSTYCNQLQVLLVNLTNATQVKDVAHFLNLDEDVFKLIAIANIYPQVNHSWLTFISSHLGIAHIDAVVA